ncbi:MAG: hypothetical protein IKL34_05415 [Alistipes sp.]|nr:hypothetical protein [Alistipes sp.]
MKLLLKRIALRESYTIGKLYVDGTYFCDTCEDRVRDNNRDGDLDDIGEGKVYGQTAIPYGTYKVVMNVQSPKYSQRAAYAWCKGYLPRLVDVPHFEGILIHSGNDATHSAGCILVGENKVRGQVINSMATLKRLVNILKSADNITITIE